MLFKLKEVSCTQRSNTSSKGAVTEHAMKLLCQQAHEEDTAFLKFSNDLK